MTPEIEFLAGLAEQGDDACVGAEDFDGLSEASLRNWQSLGFVAQDAASHPTPGCPHCGEGIPCSLGGRILCNTCFSTVDPNHQLLWRFNTAAFLRWLAEEAHIRGDVRRIDSALWQLGSWAGLEEGIECFFSTNGPLTKVGHARLSAYRRTLVFSGRSLRTDIDPSGVLRLTLLDVLRDDGRIAVTPLKGIFRPSGKVRFNAATGVVWLGDRYLGEVPHGCKEFYLLCRLAADLDQFVSYHDLKRDVLSHSGSSDTTDEATFCQKLKSRIKAKWVPRIDELIVTTNKADGYRLRSYISSGSPYGERMAWSSLPSMPDRGTRGSAAQRPR
jgi:hypothetical protein